MGHKYTDLPTAQARIDELEGLINTPEVDNFLEGIRLEAAHQQERWCESHDEGKGPPDWFWLIGFLAGKALTAIIKGDLVKGKHHTISTAAALFNWHRHLTGELTNMRPGIANPRIDTEEVQP